MTEERQQGQDVGDEASEMREHEQEARERERHEGRPEDRGEANTAGEAADLQGG